MGIAIIDKTASYDPAKCIGKIVPVMSGLKILHFGGDTVSLNQVIDGDPVTRVGSPVRVDSYSSRYSAGNYVRSVDVFNADEGTFLLTPRLNVQASGQAALIGTWPLGRGVSVINVLAGTTAAIWLAARTTKSDNSAALLSAIMVFNSLTKVTDPATAPYAFLVGRWYRDSAGLLQLDLKDLTHSLSAVASGAAGQIVTAPQSTDFIGIGASAGSSASSGGNANVQAFAAYYNRRLTDSEVGLIYEYVRSYMSRRGISI